MTQVKDRVKASFRNKDQLLKAIDELPRDTSWQCHNISVAGDFRDDGGSLMKEELELWFRDPVECVRELIGNPAFREVMAYAPEKIFEDSDGKCEVWNEMWTADWWWNTQVRFNTAKFRDVRLTIFFVCSLNSLQALQLPLSSSHPIKPSFRSFVVTKAHGLCT